jgi:chromosome partitioning protein
MTDTFTVVIAVVNNKGGVGKTTTAVHLAAALASPRRSVLLIDLDSLASASLWFGVARGELRPSIASCFLQDIPLHKVIRHTGNARLDLVTGSIELANMDLALCDMPGREVVLTRLVQSIGRQYDVVVLDCPPGLSLVGINALVAADAYIVPVTPEFLAVEGLVSLLESVDKVRSRMGAKGRLLGIALTMVDPSRRAATEMREQLRAQYRDRVFHTEIGASRTLAEVPGSGKTVLETAPKSRAADAYRRLAGEVLERLRH